MTDREKIIKEWEMVMSRDPLDAPWDLIDNTLTLLKEQEAVEPKRYRVRDADTGTEFTQFYCGVCERKLYTTFDDCDPPEFCAHCGQEVKWE